MHHFIWTPEHCLALPTIARGLSYREVARRLSSNFTNRLPLRRAWAGPCAWAFQASAGRARSQGVWRSSICQSGSKGTGVAKRRQERAAAEFYPSGAVGDACQARHAALPQHHAAADFADRAQTERLPLSLWRRQGRRSRHLLRPSKTSRLKLLRAEVPSDRAPGPVMLHLVEAARLGKHLAAVMFTIGFRTICRYDRRDRPRQPCPHP